MKSYKNILIYFFSGTGNAKNAAGWIAADAGKYGIENKVINIASDNVFLPESPRSETLLGFCFPTHGFNAPPIMLRFLINFPKGDSDVFIVNTRGGTKLGPLYFPGLSGAGQILPAIILKFKGYNISGFRPLDLPSNWLSLHPALRGTAVTQIYKRCRGIISRFTEKIFNGEKVRRGLYDLPLDLLILPISIAYYFFGRFLLAKTFYADEKCDNCGACIKNCPVNAIELVGGKPFWNFKCESCMKCMTGCPEKAIQTSHGFSISLWILPGIILPPLISWFMLKLGYEALYLEHESSIFFTLINTTFTFGLVWIMYRMMHKIKKFSLPRLFLRFSSLTRLKFWGRYRASKNIR